MKGRVWKKHYEVKVYGIIVGIVLVLCVICAAAAIVIIRDYSNEQYGKANLDAARNAASTITVLSDSMKRESIQLTSLVKQETNNTIKRSSFLSGTPTSVLLRRNLYSYLWNLVYSNSKYNSIYLYFEEIDYVITSYGKYLSREEFQDQEWYTAWKQDSKNNELWMKERVIHWGEATTDLSVITVVYPLSIYVAPNIRGLVVFNLEKKAIGELISQAENQTTILTDRGQVIFLYGDNEKAEMIESLYQDNALNTEGAGYFINTDSNDMVSYTGLKNNSGWKLIRLSGMKEGERLVEKSLNILILIVIGIFFAAAMAAVFLAKRISRPLTRIHELLKQDARFQNAEPDEVRHVESALEFLQKEEKRLSNEMIKQKEERKRQLISDLFVADQVDTKEWENECGKELALQMQEKNCLTLYFSNDANISAITHYHGDELIEYRRLTMQMFAEKLGEKNQILEIAAHRDFVFVILQKEEWANENVQKIAEVLREIQKQVSSSLGFFYTVGVSSPWKRIENAHISYEEAREAARGKLIKGYQQILVSSSTVIPAKLLYSSRQEQRLINAVHTHDLHGTTDEIEIFLAQLSKMEYVSADSVILDAYLFVGTLVKALSEEGGKYGIRIPEVSLILEYVYGHSFETIMELKEFLIRQVTVVMKRIKEASEAESGIIQKIYSYIGENYQSDIGIEEISEAFGVSYSHIRKIFKESVGVTIPDAINQKRISAAKELLLETDLNIAQIAARIGYNSEQSFSRNFKKYENMLPSQFRMEKRSN